MSGRPPDAGLGTGTALVLRWGTLVAMLVIGGGYLAALASGSPAPDHTPLVSLVAGGGPDAVIGIGLLALTLIPLATLAVALAALARSGERRRALTAAVVLLLLLASLATAALLGAPS